MLFMGFSWQEYWSDLPFPPPVNHILSELCTVTGPSRAWLIVSLSYSSPFTTTSLLFIKGIYKHMYMCVCLCLLLSVWDFCNSFLDNLSEPRPALYPVFFMKYKGGPVYKFLIGAPNI